MKSYDFLVLGGGSAGFNAARVAQALGKRVAIVDGGKPLGGLCILRGCMPSKTLLYVTEVLHQAQRGVLFGLNIPQASADLPAMQARKKRIIADFAGYREKQLASGKYDLYRQQGRFADSHTIELEDGEKLIAEKILIATGSRVNVPPVPGLADTPFWTSDEILDLDFVPESVIVLGGGIVACEMSQFLARIGTRVTLIQRSPHILSDHSIDASAVVQTAFRAEGIDLITDTQIQKISKAADGVTVNFLNAGTPEVRTGRYLFNALGREPNSDGLNLAAAGVRTSATGRVMTNRYQQTTAPHIYAGGDVCGPFDIVHLAVAQGELAARHAFAVPKVKTIDRKLLLNVVFTDPQLATIGQLESELTSEEVPFISASYPFNDHGKSILMEANYGYVRVIAEPKRGRILGAEIVGKDAGELIHCFSGPLAMRATVFDLLRAPWYHPTLAEIITYPLEEIADKINGASG